VIVTNDGRLSVILAYTKPLNRVLPLSDPTWLFYRVSHEKQDILSIENTLFVKDTKTIIYIKWGDKKIE